jgi:rare lipoprotein A (peptidoglycan hydrolase)
MKMSDQSRAMPAATLPAAVAAGPTDGYSQRIRAAGLTAIAVVVLAAGCGSSAQRASDSAQRASGVGHATGFRSSTSSSSSRSSTATGTVPTAHPQAVEPTAGQVTAGGGSVTSTGVHAAPASPSGHPKLTGPASVTSAPAKGAPSAAQIRSALVSLQATERRYRLDRVDTSGAVLDAADLPSGRWYTSIASFYGAPLFGNGVACGGILHPWTLGVANKTLPCGTQVLFQYGSRAIEVRVIDRGPYIAGREWDLTAATAVALHFPGLGPVQWRLVR